MSSITATSTKAEILSNACEAIDSQQARIHQLEQQQTTLFIVCGILAGMLILF